MKATRSAPSAADSFAFAVFLLFAGVAASSRLGSAPAAAIPAVAGLIGYGYFSSRGMRSIHGQGMLCVHEPTLLADAGSLVRAPRRSAIAWTAAGVAALLVTTLAGGLAPAPPWMSGTAGFVAFVLCVGRALAIAHVDDRVFATAARVPHRNEPAPVFPFRRGTAAKPALDGRDGGRRDGRPSPRPGSIEDLGSVGHP